MDTNNTVDISGLDKVEVLRILYSRARVRWLGLYVSGPLSRIDAEKALAVSSTVDYLYGRIMKIVLDQDCMDIRAYDRENGSGTAAAAVYALRATNGVSELGLGRVI